MYGKCVSHLILIVDLQLVDFRRDSLCTKMHTKRSHLDTEIYTQTVNLMSIADIKSAP